MIIHRVYADNDIIIYRRHRGCEKNVKLYFELNRRLNQSTGREFKSKSQIVAYLKKVGKITV